MTGIYWQIKCTASSRDLGDYLLEKLVGRIFPTYIFNSVSEKTSRYLKLEQATLCISFDCEYRKDIQAIPKLLSLLDEYKLKASFACIGRWIEEYPKEHKLILKNGHEILNHTYSHPNHEELNKRRFDELTSTEKRDEIIRCHRVCQETLGYEMIGFRAPHFGNVSMSEVYRILHELKYTYSSSTIASNSKFGGAPYNAARVIELPLSVCPAHPWTVLDSYHSFVRGEHNDFKEVFQQLLQTAASSKSLINIYFDPSVVEEKAFEEALKMIKAERDHIDVLRLCDFVKSMNTSELPVL